MKLIANTIAAALLLAGTAAGAVTVYSENFNAPVFVGAVLLASDTSDRFGPTTYYFINDFGGWTFNTSSTFLATPIQGEDGALLLNETNGSASRLITGLTIGTSYALSFLLSGDNRPGQAYVLNGGIAGLTFTVNGTDGASGTNPGSLLSYGFTATSTSHTLSFSESSLTSASPIIDNISIESVAGVVPEPASWALLLAGFGMVGFAARRRRAAIAA
jgi:hypothetical protein